MSREEELNKALEAMFYGFSAMTKKPDQHLASLGFSRIHHRILYFIARQPGLSVKQLLAALKMSKQYIHKPLKQLLEQGLVQQSTNTTDRRVKCLNLTTKGKALEEQLSSAQRQQFAKVFNAVGKEAEQHWHQVMRLLCK